MTPLRMSIGNLIESVQTWNPERQPTVRTFTYIDLGSVDQTAKTVAFERTIRCGDAPSRARQIVKAGDILVSTVRPNLNAVAVVPDHLDGATASTGFCVLRPRHGKLDANYLFQWVKTPNFIEKMARRATGASYPAISDRIIASSTLPLPPLAEQRRIAEILDKADALRARRRAALAQLDTLTLSIFLDMFGDPATNPLGLRRALLGDTTTITTGSTPSRDVDSYFGGNIPWVKTTEIDGGLITDTGEKLTESGLRAIRGKVHPPGSIVIAMYGQGKTRGRSAQLGIAAAVNQACAVVRPDDCYVSDFMLTQLSLSYERLRNMARGGNQENLNLALVASFPVILPPRDQQETFRVAVEKVRSVKEICATSMASLNALFASLQHRAFRGEL